MWERSFFISLSLLVKIGLYTPPTVHSLLDQESEGKRCAGSTVRKMLDPPIQGMCMLPSTQILHAEANKGTCTLEKHPQG